MKQKDAVVKAVSTVMGDTFVQGETVVSAAITADQKKLVCQLVAEGIVKGDVDYSKDATLEAEVLKYVKGMVDNHFRKAKELNGGASYKPTKEGTKRDPQLKELNKLLNAGNFDEQSEQYLLIKTHIEQRKAELAASKKPVKQKEDKPQIDTSILPSHLAELINN